MSWSSLAGVAFMSISVRTPKPWPEKGFTGTGDRIGERGLQRGRMADAHVRVPPPGGMEFYFPILALPQATGAQLILYRIFTERLGHYRGAQGWSPNRREDDEGMCCEQDKDCGDRGGCAGRR